MPLVKRRAPARRADAAPPLDAADPAARRAAALARAGDPDATAPLLRALATEPARDVRAAIVTALIATRSEAAAEGMAGLLGSEDAALRNDAVEALRRMGSAAEAPLGAALRDADPDRRLLAVTALDGAAPPFARACLRGVLATETEVNVGLAAVEALAGIGLAEDAPALAAFAARFPDEPMVAFAVALARRCLVGAGP
jgi:HEAT repeat protein